ncbi:MAG: glycosyltransferase family 4 protein [Actinomycetota bacterium]|nr:glycosyltransferase family 4 protein [Actinomycetota bacterium]
MTPDVTPPSTSNRLLVVSHPSVLAVNQLPYEGLREHGWDPWLVVPSRWRHELSSDDMFAPQRLPALAGRISTRRVILAGRVQRHLYATEISRILGQVAPEIAFLEAEPTSLAAFQWGLALHRLGIPFGVQIAENLPRRYPAVARLVRRWSTARAAFAAARSPAAARLLGEQAPALPTPLIPHHVPGWTEGAPPAGGRPFTVGYAGRFVPEKGLDELVRAVSLIGGARARLVGNGPMLGQLREQAAAGAPIDIVTDATHDGMAAVYAGFDVLVLPSRTTRRWAEQFGRVLVEALWCGVPVIGSSSGEIPWVVESTGGGVVFPEGDVDALCRALVELRDDPHLRSRLARSGRSAVEERFSVPAVARALSAALRSALAGGRG